MSETSVQVLESDVLVISYNEVISGYSTCKHCSVHHRLNAYLQKRIGVNCENIKLIWGRK